MVTYGKNKKRLALPTFRSSKKQTAVQADTVSTALGSQRNTRREPRLSPQDDSIDEMASMLLDDTAIDQLKADPGKRLSQISLSKGLPGISQGAPQNDKALPRLPSLLFNGDNVWAFKSMPVITATGNINEVQFDHDADESVSLPSKSQMASQEDNALSYFDAPYMSLTPPIPRKSSKRKSSRPKSISLQSGTIARKAISKSVSTPNNLTALTQHKSSSPLDTNHVDDKIQQMLAATNLLKGDTVGVKYHTLSDPVTNPTTIVLHGPPEGAVLHGPMVSTKKRLSDYRVLSRMKTVIGDRLNARSLKKRHDPVRDDRLLDNSLNDFKSNVPPTASAISSFEIGFNERKNLRTKSKSKLLTGCQDFPRKPIQENAQDKKLFKLTHHPFSFQPSLSPRTPTESEHLLDSMSVDQSGDAGLHDSSTPASRYNDFDALCSSSPEAQSTPRIRLEPYFSTSGKRTLEYVPADSRSLFDPDNSDFFGQHSDMEVDFEPVKKATNRMSLAEMDNDPNSDRITDAAKRKSSQLRAPSFGFESPQLKRAKKHPSPSKEELEQMQKDLEVYNDNDFVRRDDYHLPSMKLPPISTIPVLAALDPNGKIAAKQPKKGGLSRAAESMPNLVGRKRRQSLRKAVMSTPTNTKEKAEKRRSKPTYAEVDSEMDIDELQLDDSAYHIGMGRL